MNIKEIGNKIRYARGMQNVTLDDIAIKVGVAKSTIQRYEAGKIENPKLPVLESIAKALDINPAWLLGKSSNINLAKQENPKIIEYYNSLNDIGKHEAVKRVEELTFIPQYSLNYPIINAAHARTDITEFGTDDDIMDDEKY